MGDIIDIFVGIDVAKVRNAIAIADGERGGEVRFLGEVDASEEGMRRVVKRIAAKHSRIQFCYEAGPTGYGLHRLITSLGHSCIVVAPSLVPRRPGDQVKTNRRDAISLAKLLRAGELTAVWVPDEGHEAMRDLVRGRAAAVETLRVHRQQVSAFMLKHGRIFPRKKGWTMRYLRWLQEQQFDHPAHQIVLQEMVEAVRLSKERVDRLEQTIEEFVRNWSLAPMVRALQALRGIDLIVAVTFVTEIGDVRRFESPRQLMGYLGLVPSERSTGATVRRGEGGEWACPPHAGGERLDVSASAPDRNEEALPPAAGHPSGARHRLEGADASHGPLSRAEWARQEDNRGLHSNCTRACWLHVVGRPGGAEQLRSPASRRIYLAHRRGRNRGRGMPGSRFVAGLEPTPVVRSGQPRTHTRNCGIQPANQSLITDVLQVPLPPVRDYVLKPPVEAVVLVRPGP